MTNVGADGGPQRASLAAAAAGAALIAAAIYASLTAREWVFAGLAGAAGLALWRRAFLGALPTAPLLIDAAAFALFAYQRNDSLAFWQLAGSWGDALRLDVADAAVAYCVYLGGSLAALLGDARPLRPIEALGLVAVPFLFKLVVVLGADWHMAEIGGLVPALDAFPAKVFVGRVVVLFIMNEAALQLLSLVGVGRLARRPSLHVARVRAFGLRRFDAAVRQFRPDRRFAGRKIIFGALFAALAEAGLWGVVYFVTGLALELAQRAAAVARQRARQLQGRRDARRDLWRRIHAAHSRRVVAAARRRRGRLRARPRSYHRADRRRDRLPPGADADRLGRRHGAVHRPPERGLRRFARLGARNRHRRRLLVGLCRRSRARRSAVALLLDFRHRRFRLRGHRRAVRLGARSSTASAGACRARASTGSARCSAASSPARSAGISTRRRSRWCGTNSGRTRTPTIALTGRALGDFVTYPIFNKYGMVNLGEVAGGVRLLYAESLSGVINWSFAAPLFAINAIFLTAILDRSLRPIRGLFSGAGAQGLVELAVRVMRWGLWMAPIINTFLRQSADPSWYNQDGAVRSLVAIGADVGMPHDGFADFSLTMFIGLLAYDWLRVLIWFDHMGLRVATLVNLSFLGGDRLDEAAARFIGHGARTRAVPEGIRRFGTWAPLLIPFYIPRGAGVGQGVDRRRSPVARRRDARRGQDAGGRLWRRRRRRGRDGARAGVARARGVGPGTPVPPPPGAPAALVGRPQVLAGHNGSVAVELTRDGRGAAYVAGDERGGFADRPHPPTARSAAAARPFLLSLRGRRRAVVDRLGAGAPRRRLRGRTDRLQPLPHQQYGQRPARDDGARPRSARGDR